MKLTTKQCPICKRWIISELDSSGAIATHDCLRMDTSDPVVQRTLPPITLRQWYAGLAMQALVIWELNNQEQIAQAAFKQADAMIEEGAR